MSEMIMCIGSECLSAEGMGSLKCRLRTIVGFEIERV